MFGKDWSWLFVLVGVSILTLFQLLSIRRKLKTKSHLAPRAPRDRTPGKLTRAGRSAFTWVGGAFGGVVSMPAAVSRGSLYQWLSLRTRRYIEATFRRK
ncbi:MAG: hypothetical protein HYY13_10275 [Nitrospirae bacterium]|nr:hypothetical protein [Nitrospirota bacterium]